MFKLSQIREEIRELCRESSGGEAVDRVFNLLLALGLIDLDQLDLDPDELKHFAVSISLHAEAELGRIRAMENISSRV